MERVFIPLHVKSDYSLGYGTASVDELVDRAAALGYRSLALTDLENLYGQVRFHHRCRQRGLLPITGVEFRPGFDGRRPGGQGRPGGAPGHGSQRVPQSVPYRCRRRGGT